VDSVEVVVQGAWRFDQVSSKLYISREPHLAIGRHVALIKFVAPVAEKVYRVQHYNQETRDFTGPVEEVYFPEPFLANAPSASYKEIENSPFGVDGWYIFGDLGCANGRAFVRAMEPRAVNNLEREPNKGRVHYSYSRQKSYFAGDSWENIRSEKGTYNIIDFENNDKTNEWVLGQEYLVVHEYGGVNGKFGQNNPRFRIFGNREGD
jgi:predicted Abi (CAAX) family protease